MTDEQNENDEQNDPNRDTGDPEVPIIRRSFPATKEAHHRRKKAHSTHHHVKRTLDILENIWPSTSTWTTLATVVMAVATAIYAVYAGRQWKAIKDQLPELHAAAEAAKDSAKATGKQLEMSERPWMKAEFSVQQPIEFQANGDMGVRVHVVMTNIGHSVATDVRLVLGADPEGGGLWFTQVPKEQKDMCENWRNFPSTGNGSSTTLFPGEGVVEDDSFVVTREQMRKVEAEVGGKEVITGIALFGCVNYGFAFASEHHQTGSTYDLILPSPQPPHPTTKFGEATGGASYMNLGENIPATKLTIRRSLFGGFYVD